MKKLLFSIPLVVLIFFSCQKEEEKEIFANSPSPEFSSGLLDHTNSNNPLDDKGSSHNDFLDYVNGEGYQSGGNITDLVDYLNEAVSDYTNNGITSWEDSVYDEYTSEFSALEDITFIEVETMVNDWYNNIDISFDIKERFLELVDILETPCSSCSLETYLNTMITDIKNMESEVNSSAYSQDDKDAILSSTAIARYSIYYWYTQGKDGADPWDLGDPDLAANVPRWATADAAGAMTSLTVGASTWGALVGGPVGFWGVTLGMAAFASAMNG